LPFEISEVMFVHKLLFGMHTIFRTASFG